MDTGQQPVESGKQVPPPPTQPGGGVSFFDDPKIRAVLQTTIAPIVVGVVLRYLKIKSDPGLVSSLSAWLVSTILPGAVGLGLMTRAIYRRVKAGRDPNNPAKPIVAPKLPGTSREQ